MVQAWELSPFTNLDTQQCALSVACKGKTKRLRSRCCSIGEEESGRRTDGGIAIVTEEIIKYMIHE